MEPTRPFYPSTNKKHIVWVKATAPDPSLTPARTETPIEASRALSLGPESADDESEAHMEPVENGPVVPFTGLADGGPSAITRASSGRAYEEWWGKPAGRRKLSLQSVC